MNIARLFNKFAPKGTLSRTVYDLATGLPGPGSVTASDVPAVLLGRSQIEHGKADSAPVREFLVLVAKSVLVEKGFPCPPADGDMIEVAGTKGTIRVATEKVWRNETVYECRFEGVNA